MFRNFAEFEFELFMTTAYLHNIYDISDMIETVRIAISNHLDPQPLKMYEKGGVPGNFSYISRAPPHSETGIFV